MFKKIEREIERLVNRASPSPDTPEDEIFFVIDDKETMEDAAESMRLLLDIAKAAEKTQSATYFEDRARAQESLIEALQALERHCDK